MASTASRIIKAFRSVFGRFNPATSQNPVDLVATTSKIPVTSSIPKPEVSETSQKPAPESSDTSLRDKAILSQSTSSSQTPAASAATTTTTTSTKPLSSETKEQTVTSSSSEASKPADTSKINDSTEKVTSVLFESEDVPKNPPNVVTQTHSSQDKPPKLVTKQPQSENVVRLSPLKSLKAHVPLIKFRKGQLLAREMKDSFGETFQEIKSTSEQGKIPLVGLAAIDEMGSSNYHFATNVTSQEDGKESLEWWQTPDKYKRRFIDEKECDIINSGGSDQIFN